MTVEKYIAHLRSSKSKPESVIKRIEEPLKKSVKFFDDKGIEHPTEADYNSLKEYWIKNQHKAKNVATEITNSTKDFYSWREAQQRATPVENELVEESNISTSESLTSEEAVNSEAEKVIEPVTETAMKENTEPIKPDEAQQTRPRGRKTYDSSGEKRTEKFTVYLTPTISENVQDIARIKRKSVADYVASLISEDCEREAERIAKFRELSNE